MKYLFRNNLSWEIIQITIAIGQKTYSGKFELPDDWVKRNRFVLLDGL